MISHFQAYNPNVMQFTLEKWHICMQRVLQAVDNVYFPNMWLIYVVCAMSLCVNVWVGTGGEVTWLQVYVWFCHRWLL